MVTVKHTDTVSVTETHTDTVSVTQTHTDTVHSYWNRHRYSVNHWNTNSAWSLKHTDTVSVIETQIQCQSLKHTQLQCTVTETHTIHGHWNTHRCCVSHFKKNTDTVCRHWNTHRYRAQSLEHTQCMVTGTHTAHGHWNTHSAWSLEHTQRIVTGTHTMHGHWNTQCMVWRTQTQYQVSETHIYTGYSQLSDKISWYIPQNIHTQEKLTSQIHLNQQLPYNSDFLQLPGSVAGPVSVLLALGTDTSMVLGGLALCQSMIASTVEAAVFWSAKNKTTTISKSCCPLQDFPGVKFSSFDELSRWMYGCIPCCPFKVNFSASLLVSFSGELM